MLFNITLINNALNNITLITSGPIPQVASPAAHMYVCSSKLRKQENAKKRAYEQPIREIEHGSFTPLVLSLTGSMGPTASVFYKRLASMLAQKRDQTYSSTMAWLRCSLSFALLRSSIQCVRGARSAVGRAARDHLPPADLVSSEAGYTDYP